MERYDVIVIGAGHNGLIAAAYLAQAGLKVCVCERNAHPGGSLVNLAFHPGFVAPAGAHTISLLGPKIMRDLDLQRFGLDMIPVPGRISFHQDGDYVSTYPQDRFSKADMARWSPRDAESYAQFLRMLTQQRHLLEPTLQQGIAHPLRHVSDEVRHAMHQMGEHAGYEIAGFWLRSCREILDRYFETDLIKAHLAGPALIGSARGPYAPGTAYHILHQRLAPDAHGTKGFVKGGPQAFSLALAKAVEAAGGSIHYETSVSGIVLEKDRAVGVTTDDGNEFACSAVLSNLDLKRTFLTLFGRLDESVLPVAFQKRVLNHRIMGTTAKLNIALDALPHFDHVPQDCPALRGTLHFAQSLEEIERASDACADGMIPERPLIEAALPSHHDPALAPTDKHVMSVYVQYVPHRLFDGRWDDDHRQRLVTSVIDQIADFSPNFKDAILGWHLAVPSDLEESFSLTAGDIHHGEMALDQLLFQRPLPGFDEALPFAKNLYMCGAGMHPGGGVTGVPGYLGAMRVLKERQAS